MLARYSICCAYLLISLLISGCRFGHNMPRPELNGQRENLLISSSKLTQDDSPRDSSITRQEDQTRKSKLILRSETEKPSNVAATILPAVDMKSKAGPKPKNINPFGKSKMPIHDGHLKELASYLKDRESESQKQKANSEEDKKMLGRNLPSAARLPSSKTNSPTTELKARAPLTTQETKNITTTQPDSWLEDPRESTRNPKDAPLYMRARAESLFNYAKISLEKASRSSLVGDLGLNQKSDNQTNLLDTGKAGSTTKTTSVNTDSTGKGTVMGRPTLELKSPYDRVVDKLNAMDSSNRTLLAASACGLCLVAAVFFFTLLSSKR